MNIYKVLRMDGANFKCNITISYYQNYSLCCFLTSIGMSALEGRMGK